MEKAIPVAADKKKVVRYHELRDCKVGHRALVWPIDHPDIPVGSYGKTTTVQSFDPLSGVAETANTRYELGPFAQWSERRDDTNGLTNDVDTVVASASLPERLRFNN
jgi:hypothetical protein